MSNIDWLTAPTWADSVAKHDHGGLAWLGENGYCFFGGSGSACHPHRPTGYARKNFLVIELRPWTGEGLPPVGTVCLLAGETLTLKPIHPDWAGAEVKVYAHFETDQGRKLAAYVSEDHMKGGVGVAELFRPKLTAEQIAAEERLAAIKEMASAAHRPGQISVTKLEMAERLYDAGYRKQVQP